MIAHEQRQRQQAETQASTAAGLLMPQVSSYQLGGSSSSKSATARLISGEQMQEAEVEMRGSLRDIKHSLAREERQHMLTIEPVREFHKDSDYNHLSVPGSDKFKNPPAEKFRIRWKGRNESFNREVVGVKATLEVIEKVLTDCFEHKQFRDNFFDEQEQEQRRLQKAALIDEAEKAEERARKLRHEADLLA